MLRWFRDRHRRELVESPFANEWLSVLEENVRLYRLLNGEEQLNLRNDLRIFLDEKNWEGCSGLIMTDEIKVTVSAHACLLMLGLEHDFYSNVESILVYPNSYVVKTTTPQPGGLIRERNTARLGEAWLSGPVVLSWQEALRSGRGESPGSNVTLHEFAHKLDMASGGADGVPRLQSDDQYDLWAEVMSKEYRALTLRIAAGENPLMDTYAATNPAEFFAVATEMFFESAHRMLRDLPNLYEVLRDFYRQDTASRNANDELDRITEG